jgi:hypothetical protein
MSILLRGQLILALRNKHICRQLNILRLYASLKVLEVLLEIHIYLLDSFSEPLLSFDDLNFSYLSPLIIELLFQELTRLHIEHDNFFGTELKFHIDFLEFGHFLFKILLLFLLLLAKNFLNPRKHT